MLECLFFVDNPNFNAIFVILLYMAKKNLYFVLFTAITKKKCNFAFYFPVNKNQYYYLEL